MPPIHPQGGYGPANYAAGRQEGPFDAADNTINYNNMSRYEAISQYRQLPPTSYMSEYPLRDQQRIGMQERYQYGVPAGQDMRTYSRQAAMNRMSYSAAMASAGSYYAIGEGLGAVFGIANAVRSGAGIAAAVGGGIGLGTAAAWLAPLAPMYFIDRGIQNSMERQKYMHSIASDVETYRGRLGFDSLSYSQASSLGSSMSRDMFTPGQFFNREQQMRVHKIALSNDMISSRGVGNTGGTIQQYQKNFNELKDTTQEVVKLLKTTIEGGMSVMKELQGAGFTSMKQIRQQVLQAKAFGESTGIGSQNMMQLGVAGAQSVQGTMWQAATGASMYQSGAMQAATMARTSSLGSYAVERMGGAAAAGGAIARSQMNVLMSGFGTRYAAYAMNPDGTVNNKRMNDLMYGKVGAYSMVVGANATGYAMGESGRALFPIYKEQFYNNMNDQGRTMAVMNIFDAWGQNRRGSVEAKAYKFASMYSNDPREQQLLMQNILSPKGFAQSAASSTVERMLTRDTLAFNPVKDAWRNFYDKSWAGDLDRFGSDVFNGVDYAIARTGSKFGEAKRGVSGFFSRDIGRQIGMPGGAWSTSRPMDRQSLLRKSFGLEDMGGGTAGYEDLQAMSAAEVSALRNVKPLGPAYSTKMKVLINSMSGDDAQYLVSTLQAASTSGASTTEDVLRRDARVGSILKKSGGNAMVSKAISEGNALGFVASLLPAAKSAGQSAAAAMESSMDSLAKYYKVSNFTPSQRNRSEFSMGAAISQLVDLRTQSGSIDFAKSKAYGALSDPEKAAVKARLDQDKIGLRTAHATSVDIEAYKSAAVQSIKDIIPAAARVERYSGVFNPKSSMALSVSTGGGSSKFIEAIKKYGGYDDKNKDTEQESLISAIENINSMVSSYNYETNPDKRAESSKAIKAINKSLGFDIRSDERWTKQSEAVRKYRISQAAATQNARGAAWMSYAQATGVDAKSVKIFGKLLSDGYVNGTSLDSLLGAGADKVRASLGVSKQQFDSVKTKEEFKQLIDMNRATYDPSGSGNAELAKSIRDLAKNISDLAGKDKLDSGDKEKLDKMSKDLDAKKATLDSSIAMEGKGGPGVPGIAIGTTPKVLNYWSNQWAL